MSHKRLRRLFRHKIRFSIPKRSRWGRADKRAAAMSGREE